MSAKAKSFLSKYALAVFAVLTIMSECASACANGSKPFTPFDLRSDRYFSTYNAVVGSYLRAHSPHRGARACVIGRTDGNYKLAWVIWRGGGRLVLWAENTEGLKHPLQDLSLRKDVVATKAQIGTSTYLVDRPWVNKLERQCGVYGRHVTVN
jgi:hypothetical protein